MGEEPKYVGEGTGRSDMNVLMIGLDSTLAIDKEKVSGDSQKRHILYGKYLSKLFIVTYSNKGMNAGIKRLSDNVIVYPAPSRNLLTFVYNAYKISKRICKENKIDVITTQEPFFTGVPGYFLKIKFNIPLIVQLHADFLNNTYWLKESKINYILNMIGKYIVKRADGVRVVSERIKDYLIKELRIAPQKVFKIPVFTDVSRFINYNQELKIKTKYSNYSNIVLFMGRLIPTKNLPMLLKAILIVLQKHSNTLFLIVGDGKDKEKLEKRVMNRGIENNVLFEGSVKDVTQYYYSCDFLVLPSNYEGWGRVAIEALASGKPIVMTDVGCANEAVINGENGFVVPKNDSNALAQKIIYLLDNPEIRKEMGEVGRKFVKDSQDIVKNAYMLREVYDEIVSKNESAYDNAESG